MDEVDEPRGRPTDEGVGSAIPRGLGTPAREGAEYGVLELDDDDD